MHDALAYIQRLEENVSKLRTLALHYRGHCELLAEKVGIKFSELRYPPKEEE